MRRPRSAGGSGASGLRTTTLRAFAEAMRPKQWTKNGFVFAAVLFARRLTDPPSVAASAVAFVCFCLAASACYLVNDLADADRDRRHPDKSGRPVASGRLNPSVALFGAVALAVASLAGAGALHWDLAVCVAVYLMLTLAYTFRLKHLVILDVMAISLGFLLRAVAGAVAISVEISPWLLVCTFLLSLFLSLAKRRSELALLETDAGDHRDTLNHYTTHLLDQMTAVVTSATVIAYCLYTFSERTIHDLGTTHLQYTVPFVVYGVFRYLYLTHRRGLGGDPSQLFLTDRPLQATLALWVAVAALVLYAPV